MQVLGRHVYTIAFSVYTKGKCRLSLPRKVLCDTSARCLTACQHRKPVLFFHCVLKYRPAPVMARRRRLLLLLLLLQLLCQYDVDNEQT